MQSDWNLYSSAQSVLISDELDGESWIRFYHKSDVFQSMSFCHVHSFIWSSHLMQIVT